MTRTKKQAVLPKGHPALPITRKREAEPAAPKEEKRVRLNAPDTDQTESDTSTENQDDDSEQDDFVFETDSETEEDDQHSDSASEAGSTVTEPHDNADFVAEDIDAFAFARRAENGSPAK
jgi:hypothetical protein